MLIRREKPEEFSQIYDLVKVAFQTAQIMILFLTPRNLKRIKEDGNKSSLFLFG